MSDKRTKTVTVLVERRAENPLLPFVLFFMSAQWFVIEPRPNVRPRPATVDECHIRAWCSTLLVPNSVMSFL